MKFAIVSDTHDNLPNLNKVIDFLNKENINVVLHCGDISNQETINEASKNFKGEIKLVRGNADFSLQKLAESMKLDLGGKKIAFVHFPQIAKQLAESKKFDLVFYGHTHRPWEEKIGNCRLVNPGEVAGQRYKPTFALYDTDTDKLELKILEKI